MTRPSVALNLYGNPSQNVSMAAFYPWPSTNFTVEVWLRLPTSGASANGTILSFQRLSASRRAGRLPACVA